VVYVPRLHQPREYGPLRYRVSSAIKVRPARRTGGRVLRRTRHPTLTLKPGVCQDCLPVQVNGCTSGRQYRWMPVHYSVQVQIPCQVVNPYGIRGYVDVYNCILDRHLYRRTGGSKIS